MGPRPKISTLCTYRLFPKYDPDPNKYTGVLIIFCDRGPTTQISYGQLKLHPDPPCYDDPTKPIFDDFFKNNHSNRINYAITHVLLLKFRKKLMELERWDHYLHFKWSTSS